MLAEGPERIGGEALGRSEARRTQPFATGGAAMERTNFPRGGRQGEGGRTMDPDGCRTSESGGWERWKVTYMAGEQQ